MIMTETPVKTDIQPNPDIQPNTEAGPEPELDEEILAEVMRGLGTSLRNEAINTALQAYAETKRKDRRQAREELRRMSDEGAFDYSALDEVDD
jgi:hypothetical protein